MLVGVDEAGAVTHDTLRAWWRTQDPNAADALDRARVLFGLFDALDITVPARLWAPVLSGTAPSGTVIPGIGVRTALTRAAADGRRGETVALSLVALGNAGLAANNLFAVELAVRALRKVGLSTDAQRIALEAAVLAGL